MNHTRLIIAGVLFADVLIACYLFFVRWTPEAASRRAHENFITALAERDTGHLADAISPDYADSWGLDEAQVEDGFRRVLGGFISIVPEWTESGSTLGDGKATFTGRMRIGGKALPLGQFVQARLERTRTPFTFTWERDGPPWSWKITKVENEGLRIPKDFGDGVGL